jgi:aminoglycoside 2'-N-acetyltransferase I
MGEVRTAHTADVDPATLAAARALLDGAFEGEFADHDWEHALGGIHALVWDGGELVGHASVIGRRLLYGGRALRAGYIEAVAVRAESRRRGHAAAMMIALEPFVRGAYDLGALSATEASAALYERLGWERWQGPTSALTPGGVVRTEDDDDSVYVLQVDEALDLTAELTCDWRDGDLW